MSVREHHYKGHRHSCLRILFKGLWGLATPLCGSLIFLCFIYLFLFNDSLFSFRSADGIDPRWDFSCSRWLCDFNRLWGFTLFWPWGGCISGYPLAYKPINCEGFVHKPSLGAPMSTWWVETSFTVIGRLVRGGKKAKIHRLGKAFSRMHLVWIATKCPSNVNFMHFTKVLHNKHHLWLSCPSLIPPP